MGEGEIAWFDHFFMGRERDLSVVTKIFVGVVSLMVDGLKWVGGDILIITVKVSRVEKNFITL